MIRTFPYRDIGFLIFVVLSFICTSCNKKASATSEVTVESVCTFSCSDGPLGLPISFDIVNDSTTVLVADNKVLLFSNSGSQIRQIGRSGNAKYEYNAPTIVRADNDSIFVWSAMTLQFISFNADGTEGNVYQYDSAISDFEVMGDNLVIYTAGKRGDHIVDLYSKIDNEVVEIGAVSDEHRILCQNAAVAPILIQGNKIFFAPKDDLTIYEYSCSDGSLTEYASLSSTSFNVEQLPTDMADMDRKEKSQFLKDNPITLQVISNGNNGFSLLTLEGKSILDDGNVSNADRKFVFYKTHGEKATSSSIPWGEIKYWNLLSTYGDYLYFINNNIIGSDETITLHRIRLSDIF